MRAAHPHLFHQPKTFNITTFDNYTLHTHFFYSNSLFTSTPLDQKHARAKPPSQRKGSSTNKNISTTNPPTNTQNHLQPKYPKTATIKAPKNTIQKRQQQQQMQFRHIFYSLTTFYSSDACEMMRDYYYYQ